MHVMWLIKYSLWCSISVVDKSDSAYFRYQMCSLKFRAITIFVIKMNRRDRPRQTTRDNKEKDTDSVLISSSAMQKRQKTQRQRKYSVVWCHVVQILFYKFNSRWFTLFTIWVENWWKSSEIISPICCKMALSKNKTITPPFVTFLN